MKTTYNNWNNNMMVLEPCNDGLSKVEIDESKIITYDDNMRWMFGIADRGNMMIESFLLMIIGQEKGFYLL